MNKKRKTALSFLNQHGLTVDNIEQLNEKEIEAILQIKDIYFYLAKSFHQLKMGEQILDQKLFYPQRYAYTRRDEDGIVYFGPSVKRLEDGNIEFRCGMDCETQNQTSKNNIVNYKKNTLKTFSIVYTPHDFKMLVEKNVNKFLAGHPYSKIDVRPLTDEEKANLRNDDDNEYEIIDDDLPSKPTSKKKAPTLDFFNKEDIRVEIEQVEIDANKLMEYLRNKNKDNNNEFNNTLKEDFDKYFFDNSLDKDKTKKSKKDDKVQ